MAKKIFGFMVASASLVLCVGAAQAQDSRQPIKIITPFSPGQGPEVLLRVLGDKLTKSLGQTVIIENRPGASGFIAFQAAKSAPPDGNTFVQIDSYHVGTHPYLFKKLPYEVLKDFEPVTPLIKNNFFVVVAANSKFKTMTDILGAAKAKPDTVSYGSWNVASPAHLGGMLLESATGTKMLHVPYKEVSQLYQGVANGEVDWALATPASAGPLIKGGKLRFVAVAGPKRTLGYETVPMAKEVGAPANWEIDGWNGLLAPKGSPKEAIARLNEAIAKAMSDPDVLQRLSAFTYEPFTMKPAEMASLMKKEIAKWQPILKDANIKLD